MKILGIINSLIAGIALILVLSLIGTSKNVQSLQSESRSMTLQLQQNSQVRQVTAQVATNIVKDMAQLSASNENLRQLLREHGFNVQVRQQ